MYQLLRFPRLTVLMTIFDTVFLEHQNDCAIQSQL